MIRPLKHTIDFSINYKAEYGKSVYLEIEGNQRPIILEVIDIEQWQIRGIKINLNRSGEFINYRYFIANSDNPQINRGDETQTFSVETKRLRNNFAIARDEWVPQNNLGRIKYYNPKKYLTILLQFRYEVEFGWRIFALGSLEQLGKNNICSSVPLKWTKDHVWQSNINIPIQDIIDIGGSLTYGFIKSCHYFSRGKEYIPNFGNICSDLYTKSQLESGIISTQSPVCFKVNLDKNKKFELIYDPEYFEKETPVLIKFSFTDFEGIVEADVESIYVDSELFQQMGNANNQFNEDHVIRIEYCGNIEQRVTEKRLFLDRIEAGLWEAEIWISSNHFQNKEYLLNFNYKILMKNGDKKEVSHIEQPILYKENEEIIIDINPKGKSSAINIPFDIDVENSYQIPQKTIRAPEQIIVDNNQVPAAPEIEQVTRTTRYQNYTPQRITRNIKTRVLNYLSSGNNFISKRYYDKIYQTQPQRHEFVYNYFRNSARDIDYFYQRYGRNSDPKDTQRFFSQYKLRNYFGTKNLVEQAKKTQENYKMVKKTKNLAMTPIDIEAMQKEAVDAIKDLEGISEPLIEKLEKLRNLNRENYNKQSQQIRGNTANLKFFLLLACKQWGQAFMNGDKERQKEFHELIFGYLDQYLNLSQERYSVLTQICQQINIDCFENYGNTGKVSHGGRNKCQGKMQSQCMQKFPESKQWEVLNDKQRDLQKKLKEIIQGDYQDSDYKIKWSNDYERNLCVMLINFAVSHSIQEHPGFQDFHKAEDPENYLYFNYTGCSEFGPFLQDQPGTTNVTVKYLEDLQKKHKELSRDLINSIQQKEDQMVQLEDEIIKDCEKATNKDILGMVQLVFDLEKLKELQEENGEDDDGEEQVLEVMVDNAEKFEQEIDLIDKIDDIDDKLVKARNLKTHRDCFVKLVD